MADTPAPVGPDKPLAALSDFTKWVTGLGTAGLAFSISLQQYIGDYQSGARWFLVASWFFYAVSAIVGILLQSAFPTLYDWYLSKREGAPSAGWLSIANPWLKVPYAIGLLTLIGGSIALFVSLLLLSLAQTPPNKVAVRDAKEAIAIAIKALHCKDCVSGVDTAELVNGTQDSSVRDRIWHVRLLMRMPPAKKEDAKADVFIRASDQTAAVYLP